MIIRPKLVLGVYRFRSVIFLFFSENYHTYLPILLQIFQKNLQTISSTDIASYICRIEIGLQIFSTRFVFVSGKTINKKSYFLQKILQIIISYVPKIFVLYHHHGTGHFQSAYTSPSFFP